jgi:hypothetical protein
MTFFKFSHHGNSDENSWKSKKSPTSYDVDAICAMKKHGKVRRTIIAIATKILGRVKNIFWLVMNFCRYFHENPW